MTAYNAQTITNERLATEYNERCTSTEIYMQEVLSNEIRFAAAFGKQRIIHLLPSNGIDKDTLCNWLIEDGYVAKVIGRILYVCW